MTSVEGALITLCAAEPGAPLVRRALCVHLTRVARGFRPARDATGPPDGWASTAPTRRHPRSPSPAAADQGGHPDDPAGGNDGTWGGDVITPMTTLHDRRATHDRT